MIVQCTNCKARFRVADEKVPDRGVKVRCTKCATVFKVTRADAVDAKAPPNRDPFGLDAEENAAARRDSTQRDPLYAESPPQEEYAPNNPAQAAAGGRVVPHMPPTVSLTYGAASPHQSLDLELSLGPPSAPVGIPTASPSGSTLPPMMMSPPSARSPGQLAGGAGPAATPFRSTLPPLMMIPPAARPPAAQLSGSAIDAALDAAMASDHAYGPYEPPGPTPLQFPPMHVPPPAAPGFGASAQRLVPTPPGRSAIDPFAAEDSQGGTGTEVDPFALDDAPPPPPPPLAPPPMPARQVNLSAGPPRSPQGSADPWVGLLASKPAREETDPFAGLDRPPEVAEAPPAPPPAPPPPPPPPAPDVRAAPEAARPPQGTGTSPPSPSGLGAVPASIREIEFSESTQGHKLDLDYGLSAPDAASEQPEREKDKSRDKNGRDSAAVELGRIAVVPRGSVPEEERPKADQKTVVKSRLRRETASAAFNVASAALVFYAVVIAIAVIRSPRPVGLDDLGFPVFWLAFGSGDGASDQLRAIKVHSGIYPMHTGDELFYVEGLAQNDSSHRTDALSVTLEVVRDDHVIEHVDSIAGLQASPEDLYALNVRKNDELQRLLAQQGPVLAVEPHKSAPFIGIFKLNARDVEGADIRATVHPGVPASLKAVVGPGAGGANATDVAGAPADKSPAPPSSHDAPPAAAPKSPRSLGAAKGT